MQKKQQQQRKLHLYFYPFRVQFLTFTQLSGCGKSI